MRLKFVIISVSLLSILTLVDRALAQGITSKDQLMQSTWESSYSTPDGQQVQARIKFNGGGGSYDTAAGQGRLSHLEYGVDTNPTTGEPFFQINGKWSLLGVTGSFIFSSNGTSRFKGQWNSGAGQSGKWTGQLVAAGAGGPPQAVGAAQGQTFAFTYTQWLYYPDKNYYLKTCTFPDGTYFYAIYKPAFTKNYIFCFNPYKKVYWCCCPTFNNPAFTVTGTSISIFVTISNVDTATTVENAAIPDNPASNTKNSVPLKNANGQPIATLSSMPTDIPPG